MRWLAKLLSGSVTPPTAKPTPKAPKMVPRDFIDLTEGEAFLICEMVGGLYIGNDSRLTISERLAVTVEAEGADTSGFMLDYWILHNHEVDAAALAERLKPLSSKQARCVISAAKKFWRLDEKGEGDVSEAQYLLDVGLV